MDRFWSFYEKANRVVRTFTGPADLGAGHPEEAYRVSPQAACPICGRPMTQHLIERSGAGDQHSATRLHCPA